MKRNFKTSSLYNIIWYMCGSMFFGFTSLIYMIIITRFIGIDAAGSFSYAFAVACIFYIVGVYFGRTFQVTDTSKRYSDTDYIYNKITTCLIMIILTIIYSCIKGYNSDKFLLIIILTIYRGVEAFLESIHSVIQKKDQVHKLGKLIFFRTFLLLMAFSISIIYFKSVVLSSFIIMTINILYVLMVDYRVAKPNISTSSFSLKKDLKLINDGFWVFLFSFIAMYIINSPKYAINGILNDTSQGIFGIIVMPASFLSLASSFFVQPFLTKMVEYINSNAKLLYKYIINLSLTIILAGIIVVTVGFFIGIPLLNFIYNVNLNSYRLPLTIILVGSIFYSIYCLLSVVLIAMRKNKVQVLLLCVVSVFAFFVCYYLIKQYEILGAAWAYFLIMLFQLVLYIITCYKCIVSNKNKAHL